MFGKVRIFLQTIYKGLSPLQLILLVARLTTCILTFCFILVTLVSPIFSNGLYISRIDCAHLDVAMGLYNSLRNSVTSTPAANAVEGMGTNPIDSSLTNSEITILSKYAQAQVTDAPQYILTSLWKWCYGNYNMTKGVDNHGKVTYTKYDDVLTCSTQGARYIFDYRQELEQVGLEAILAYAYKTSKFYDARYDRMVQERSHKYNLSVSALIFSVSAQFIIIIYTVVIYSNRNYHADLKNLPQITLHILASLSIAGCTSLIIGAAIMTNLILQIQSEIEFKLGSFGVSLHLGTTWFTILWFATGMGIFNMLSWILPLWCANPDEDFEDDFEFVYPAKENVNHSHNKNVNNHRSKSTGINKIKNRFRNRKNDYQYSINQLSDSPQDNVFDNETHNSQQQAVEIQDSLTDDGFEDGHNYPTRQHSKNFEYLVYQQEAAQQDELRKLGETLSKKSTVRRMYKLKRPIPDDSPIRKDEVQHLLYDNKTNQYSNYPQLHREQTFDGYGVSRSNTLDLINEQSSPEYSKTRNLSNPSTRNNSTKTTNMKVYNNNNNNNNNHNKNNHDLASQQSSSLEQPTPVSANFSILNDDEILILNNNNDIN